MRIDVRKFAKAESRHPHKEILEWLVKFIEFDGEVPMHAMIPRHFIVGESDRYVELKKFSVERLEAAVDDLIDADVVEERSDSNSAWRTLGVRESSKRLTRPTKISKNRSTKKRPGYGQRGDRTPAGVDEFVQARWRPRTNTSISTRARPRGWVVDPPFLS